MRDIVATIQAEQDEIIPLDHPEVLGLGAVVGVLAAVLPAHRAARMDVLSAIAME
jgi:hypothetical protein